MSDVAINNYDLILLSILSVILTFYFIHKNPKGKRALDTISLYLPISGDITKQILLLKSNIKSFGIVFLSFLIIAFLSISFVMSRMNALPIGSMT